MADMFRDFEKVVIAKLCDGALAADDLRAVLVDAELVGLERSGVGYFLTVRHDVLPQERTVCSEPQLMGRGAGVDLGFVVFLQNGELTLECHAWAADAVPDNVREVAVTVREAAG